MYGIEAAANANRRDWLGFEWAISCEPASDQSVPCRIGRSDRHPAPNVSPASRLGKASSASLRRLHGYNWVWGMTIEMPYPRSRGRRLPRTQSVAVGKLSTAALATKTVSTADIPCPKVQPIRAKRPARISGRLSFGFCGTCAIVRWSQPRVWRFALCAEYLLPSCSELPDPE